MRVDAVGLMTDGTKWYPIIFKDHPEAGGSKIPRRMKSMGHHTTGYATKEEAEQGIQSDNLLKDVPRLKGDLFWGENPDKIILVNDDFTMSLTQSVLKNKPI